MNKYIAEFLLMPGTVFFRVRFETERPLDVEEQQRVAVTLSTAPLHHVEVEE